MPVDRLSNGHARMEEDFEATSVAKVSKLSIQFRRSLSIPDMPYVLPDLNN